MRVSGMPRGILARSGTRAKGIFAIASGWGVAGEGENPAEHGGTLSLTPGQAESVAPDSLIFREAKDPGQCLTLATGVKGTGAVRRDGDDGESHPQRQSAAAPPTPALAPPCCPLRRRSSTRRSRWSA